MDDLIVRMEGIHVRFRSGGHEVHAVRGVDLEVPRGACVGIVGESGSGKSTLARVLVGLVPPSEGTVTIDGDLVVGRGARSRDTRNRWKTQMVFQDPYASLDPLQTPVSAVREAVRRWGRAARRDSTGRALELLASVGLSERQARGPLRSLSGGQRQRVSIARALAPQPSILVADEPTSALDQSAQASLLNLLRRLRHERGLTTIFISHDLGLVYNLTDHVSVMKTGEVVESGPTARVFDAPEHPYTQQLLRSAFAGSAERNR